jgi:hypothetical protein
MDIRRRKDEYLTHVSSQWLKQIITDELFEVVVSLKFTQSNKREFIREFIWIH